MLPWARSWTAESCFVCTTEGCWWVERMGTSFTPLGARLDEPILLADASQFPELQAVATRLGPRPELPVKSKSNPAASSRPTTISARPDRTATKTTTPPGSGPHVGANGRRDRDRPTVGKGKTPGGRDKPTPATAVERRHTPLRRTTKPPPTKPSTPEPDDEIPDE